MFVGAVPVANAAALAWSTQTIPSALTFQIAAGVHPAFVTVASNGDIFAVDTATRTVYKSITGGVTWTASAPVGGVTAIVALQLSPNYATDNRLFVLVSGPPVQAYISVNGGITFGQLGGPVATVGTEVGTCMAISPTYNAGSGEIMVGTIDPTVATFGDAYIWGRGGVQTWVALAVGVGANTEDVTAVAFSPNYPIDATILAVGSTAANTFLHNQVTGSAWDAPLVIGGAVTITAVIAGAASPITEVIAAAAVTEIMSSVIAIPSDFNGSLALQRTVYVATRSGTVGAADNQDKINRCIVGSVVAPAAMQPNAGILDAEMTSLVFSGAGAAGTLFAGTAGVAGQLAPQVYKSVNPGAVVFAFTASVAPPSGALAAAGQNTYVAVGADYATTNKVFAGSLGVNSSLSVSEDGGSVFYGAGLIDTAIGAGAGPVQGICDLQAVDASTMYLLTMDNAVTPDSLWKTTDAGATWHRILTAVFTGNVGIIRPSPNYATDSTVYVANTATVNFWITKNSGATWIPRAATVAIGDMAVKDQNTIYVGSSAAVAVQATINGGWTWQPAATAIAAGAVSDIELDLATGHILVGSVARVVYISTNNNIFYVPVAAAVPVGAAGVSTVAFDASYATNNTVYAATTGNAGIWAATLGTSLTWGTTAVDAGATLLPGDIIVSADGTLYITDNTAAAVGAGGMVRILNATNPFTRFVERLTTSGVAGGASLPGGDTLTKLTLAANTIWAINNLVAGCTVRTYGDTMSLATPVVTAPAEAVIVDARLNPVTLSWQPVTGALAYAVRWDTRPDFFNFNAAIPAGWPNTSITQAAAFFPAGVTIYWQVRVTAPANGPWSSTHTFITEMAPAAINAPAIAAGFAGTTGIGGWNAPVTPLFVWTAIAGATGYEFQLSKDAAFSTANLVIDATGAKAFGNATSYKLVGAPLAFNTTYYWRVRAFGGTSNTSWSVTAPFTTLEQVVPPVTSTVPAVTLTPTTVTSTVITIPAATSTVITMPAATQTVNEVNPTYIWAIIIIGAVLVLAVIVLIVRTRRSV